MNNIMDGRRVALEIKSELMDKVAEMDVKPTLIVISVGENAASLSYIRAKQKAATEIGINFEHMQFPYNTSEENLKKYIESLNKQSSVSGMIVQLPLPEHISPKVLNAIDPKKDVDGLTDVNIGHLVNDDYNLLPCTPLGIVNLLKVYNVNLIGAKITVIGQSHLVGKPLANLLMSERATVTVCNSKTVDLKEHTLNADVVIVATGVPKLLKGNMVKDGAVIIDVGINKVDGKITGDVDFDSVKEKAALITPVPGGVGPMTVAMLMNNTVKAHIKNKEIYDKNN